MQVHFTYPVSDTRLYQGEFHVTAIVDGHDVEINQVIFEDRNHKRANVTYLITNWCDGLCENICEAAINASIPESDYTLEMQDQ